MQIENRPPAEYSQAEMKDIKGEFADLRVITQTFYGNSVTAKVRQKLALRFFEKARQLGLKVIVVDGGSNEDFINSVRQDYGDTVELCAENDIPENDREGSQRVGTGTGRRYGFARAMADEKAKYFLWTEPEKDELLTVDNVRSMLKSLKSGEADVSVPQRISKETMVPIQGWLESWANKIAARLLAERKGGEAERPLDLWFGPKVFNRKGGEEFLKYRSKLNKWDSNIIPAVNAESVGLKVNAVDVNYSYDPSQVKDEVGNRDLDAKRWYQFISILAELGSKEAADFYNRHASGEPLEKLVPEIISAFGMEEDMPEDIRKYLKLD